jgi:molybdopterin/thiamine biosynthesis adenylyltransferase
VTVPAGAFEAHAVEMQGLRVIALEDLDAACAAAGVGRREAEVAALRRGIVPRRYQRNIGTLGMAGQIALLKSCAAVVGLGGLGGFIVEGLARMGVGRLVLVDGDAFADHNLNRQLLSKEGNLGQLKTEAAAERVAQINRGVEVDAHAVFASADNLPVLLSGVDVVVDALDSLPARLLLQDSAARCGVPMVHGAIAGGMGQVMTILPGDPGLHALYGDGPLPEHGAEATLGTPAPSPMMVAAWQVHEVIKLLTGKGDLLRHRMLFLDALSGQVRVLGLQPDL